MTDRFAKVPEWLPAALAGMLRGPGDAAPALGVMVYVVLAARADFRSWRSRLNISALARECGCSRRSVARALDLLVRAGAVQLVDNYCLMVGSMGTGVTEVGTGAQEVGTGVTEVAYIRRSAAPFRPPQKSSDTSSEARNRPLVVVVRDEPEVAPPPWVAAGMSHADYVIEQRRTQR